MILTNNDHDQMTTVLKSDYSVHVINNESPQLSQLRAYFVIHTNNAKLLKTNS